ncbi:hypothetical protein C2W64_04836 [Brevibacillus laterosporus]|nr:tetratricopeptide repeat protein [Brevibacillus laterosporus]RAP28402.1 hypothetical protein C2W64_04836 [Brevibacillus laterosporus]
MGKFFLFSFLFWIFGNPFIALLVILLLIYLLDLRYMRLFPSWFRPIKQSSRLRKIKNDLRLNPHDTSAKLEVARILMEKKRYEEAYQYLNAIFSVMNDSAEYLSDYGICQIKQGQVDQGEANVLRAFAINPRVKYGEAYLYLSESYAEQDTAKSLSYLKSLQQLNSSSAEVYYRMGQLYEYLGEKQEAKQAYREAIEVYRGLPTYKKRMERRWSLLSWFRIKLM